MNPRRALEPEGSRVSGFEGLRAVAAFSVLVTHAAVSATGNGGRFGSVWSRLDVGVTVFFVISGFLLWRPFAQSLLSGESLPDPKRYLRHRFLRIMPAYWLVLIISYFLYSTDGQVSLGDFARHFTLTHIYTPGPLIRSPMPQSWSLANELSFYLFLPLLAWAMSKIPAGSAKARERLMWGALAALVVGAQLFRVAIVLGDFSVPAQVALKAWLPNHLDTYAVGMAAAVFSVRPRAATDAPATTLLHRIPGWLPAGVGVVAFGVITQLGLPTKVLVFSGRGEFVLHLGYTFVAACLCASVIAAVTQGNWFADALGSRPGRLLGRISYGVFLWQILVIGRYLDRHPDLRFLLSLPRTLLFVVPITIVLAIITWHLVERPALSFKHRPIPMFTGGIVAIALLSLLWRLFSFLKITTVIPDGGDPFYYHSQAGLLSAGKGFVEPFGFRATGVLTPTAFHPPLFSMWLSISSFLGTHSYLAHKTMSAFAGVGTVVLAGFLARRLSGDRAGLLAAIAVASHPHLWVIDGVLWPEGLFTFVLVAVLVLLYRWIDRPSRGRALQVGGLVGLSALVRGEALLLFPLMVAPVFWWGRSLARPERLRQFALASLAGAVVLAPWMYRSLTIFERPVVMASNSDEVLFYANCADTYSGELLGSWSFSCQARHREAHPGEEPTEESVRVKYWRDLGVDYAMEHKSRWPVVAAARLGRVWDVFRPGNNLLLLQIEGRPIGWARVGQWFFWLSVPMSLMALAMLRRRRVPVAPLVAQYLAVSVTCVLIYGSTRFRTPADLVAMILVGVALDRALVWCKEWLIAPAGVVASPTHRVATPRWSRSMVSGMEQSLRGLAWVRRRPGWARTAVGVAVVSTFVAVALPGLFRNPGAPMEEGFMLVFPERVLAGDIPNVDFLHLYGPASLSALSAWYRVFGVTIHAERWFGLLQHAATITALMVLGRMWGRKLMVSVGVVAALVTLTPVGLTALAWDGGVALGLWACLAAWFGMERGSRRLMVTSGVLAGLALAFRPDLFVALTLAAIVAVIRTRRTSTVDDSAVAGLRSMAIGLAIGTVPLVIHLGHAGPIRSISGMLLDPVFRLRDGRRLPVPPSWNQVDGALQEIALLVQPNWTIPMLAPPHQVVLWFVMLPIVCVAAVFVAWRRASTTGLSGRYGLLLMVSVFGFGLLPQALQRPDTTHLAWVSCVAFSIAPIVIYEVVVRRAPAHRTGLVAGSAGLAWMLVLLMAVPQFTWRAYSDLVHSGRRDFSSQVVERGGRSFTLGSAPIADAANRMVDDLDRWSTPGDRLFVGTADLSRTPYSDAYVYYLFPDLEPATYYIEFDPGVANAEGSGLAGDVASANWLVLSHIWDFWEEPNGSSQPGSSIPNLVVRDQFCLRGLYDGYLELYQRCGR